jgi:hypothetical protein
MKCPKCQTENPETRKFCKECKAKLILVCPHCHFENIPRDKFCSECGHKFGEGLATEGERKHVTVLFSDLSGYTPMSERLNPEYPEQTEDDYSPCGTEHPSGLEDCPPDICPENRENCHGRQRDELLTNEEIRKTYVGEGVSKR